MKLTNGLIFILMTILLCHCITSKISRSLAKNETIIGNNTIMEVTTFKTADGIHPTAFKKRDAQVQNDFTSQQPGFILQQSGVTNKDEFVVVVFWESIAVADASMSKFMAATSVVDYVQMIDGPSMKIARYKMDKPFDADGSQFVEIMSVDLQPGTDIANLQVETDYTGKQDGFLQRLTGVNQEGRQVVVVYWKNKTNSDAVLAGFMPHRIAKKIISNMLESSIATGRYKFLENH